MDGLVQILEDHRERLLSLWQEEVRRRTSLEGASLDQVIDHLPVLLEFVVERVRGRRPEAPSRAVEIHGGERFRLAVGPDDVAREVLSLPDVVHRLWRELEGEDAVPSAVMHAFEDAVHEALVISLQGWGREVSQDLDLLSASLEQAPVGVVVFDTDARHLLANAEWRRQTGLTREHALGRTSYEVWGTPESKAAAEAQLEAIRSGEGIPMQSYSHEEEGRRKHYRWGLAPLRAEHGRIMGGVAFTLETTEEVEARRHLEALRGRVVAGLAHDVRNPLTAARLMAHTLARRPEMDPAGVAERILGSIDRADRMIQNMLDASRLEGGAPVVLTPKAATDLEQVVQDAVSDLARSDRARVRVELEGEAPALGRWDGEALRRVVWNLLTNAFKHGDPEAVVSVTLKGGLQASSLSVANRGKPIPEEAQRTLFDPWQRPETAARGWGLGLFVVKALAEAHGGGISLSSEAEETRFTVTLPADPPPTDDGNRLQTN